MNKLTIILFVFILAACSDNTKDFSSVKVGMTNQEVLQYAGEPDKKQDIGVAELWVYEKADRTVVFRRDTVYDIITSANARIDSVKTTLDNLGDKIEDQADKAVDKIDSLGRRIKNTTIDSLRNN